MECNAVDRGAMRLKCMPGRGARKPGRWVLVSAGEGCGCCTVKFGLEV